LSEEKGRGAYWGEHEEGGERWREERAGDRLSPKHEALNPEP